MPAHGDTCDHYILLLCKKLFFYKYSGVTNLNVELLTGAGISQKPLHHRKVHPRLGGAPEGHNPSAPVTTSRQLDRSEAVSTVLPIRAFSPRRAVVCCLYTTRGRDLKTVTHFIFPRCCFDIQLRACDCTSLNRLRKDYPAMSKHSRGVCCEVTAWTFI